jgi:hypothetical protein
MPSRCSPPRTRSRSGARRGCSWAPPPYLGGAQFPAALEHLDDPDAHALAERFGQDPGSAAASDAPDWESYEERMGFIVTLLRSYPCDAVLFALPPGTPAG